MPRVLLAAIRCEKGDPAVNLAAHDAALASAARAGCTLAVFPEMSLTGSVEPATQSERLVAADSPLVTELAARTAAHGVAALFGIAERSPSGDPHITQLYAQHGAVAGGYRKRHLGEGEEAYVAGERHHPPVLFSLGSAQFGVGICAESDVDYPWDEPAAAGASMLFFPAAPGLYGPRRDSDDRWRAGFDWWDSHGLGAARRHARRTGTWIGMATQAGATVDEDFPGIAALIAPDGNVVDRLPDWRPGTLVVEIPVPAEPGRIGLAG